MKKTKVFILMAILLSGGLFLQQLTAQDKTKKEQEKEQKIQQSIEDQKKALAEKKKAEAEAEIELNEQDTDIDNAMKDVRIKIKRAARAGDAVRIYGPRGNRSFTFDEPFVVTTPGSDSFFSHFGGDDSEGTTLDFSKSVKENTFSRDYTFDVEKTASTVVMSIMGDCKAGEIHIKIIMPSGKNYSDIVIDEFGNLNWRKSFTISETENQDKAGEWKFQIASTKATGYFKISLQTF